VTKGKRWVWNLLRIALTAAAVLIVLGMVRFGDYVRVVDALGKAKTYGRAEVLRIDRQGERTAVRWADGRVTDHASKDVSEQEGFLSLFGRADKGLWLAMAAVLVVPVFVLSLRWWLLLRGAGFAVPFGRTFFVTYAGLFFGIFLPGSVGGDLAKALMVVSGEDRKAAAAGTLILDRLIGLAVMVVLGAACMAPFAGRFQDKTPVVVTYGLFAGMAAVSLAYFNPALRGWLKGRLPFQETLGELDGVFRMAKEEPGRTAAAAALSVLGQAAAIFAAFGMARALGITGVPLWAFFVFEPIIFIVTAVPVSVGGWGVQEGAYVYLFGTFAGMDPNQAVALSVLFKLSGILVSIPGGLLFALGFTRRSGTGAAP
jgi:hypothetical protein